MDEKICGGSKESYLYKNIFSLGPDYYLFCKDRRTIQFAYFGRISELEVSRMSPIFLNLNQGYMV
jgi:hypothetical protein